MSKRKNMGRQSLSSSQLSRYINATEESTKGEATTVRDFFEYRPKLYKQMVIPSFVHGYSLAIEYMRDWFLSHFEDKNFFKSVTVNGRHILNEWAHFNKQNIVREKPMLAIIPTVEYDYDRELLDAYYADRRILLHKSDYQQSFLKDWKSMSFLYAQPREIKMNFAFKARVSSRAEQQDLWAKMELYFRVGATETNYVSQDMHIPYELMSALALTNGFTVNEDGTIKDPMAFLEYCNKHSDMPILFKLRAINQRPEFFLRANNVRVHITTKDKIQLDDGEKEGRLDTNYHVEFQATVSIIVPQFYVFFSQQPIEHKITVTHDAIGLYTIQAMEIPPENSRGWGQKALTEYMCDIGDKEIDLSPIFTGTTPLAETMKHTMKNSISPDSFIQVMVFKSGDGALLLDGYVDYSKLSFVFDSPMTREEMLVIVVYADSAYINDTMSMLHNYLGSRIE